MTVAARPLVPEDLRREADPVRALSRALAAVAVTGITGRESAQQWLARNWPDWRPRGTDDLITRAAGDPAMTSGSWGQQVLPTLVGSFLSALAPRSGAVQLFANCTRLNFNGVHTISVPRASTSAAPVFVAEGASMRISQDVFSNVTVGPTKKMLLGAALNGELEFIPAESATAIIQTVMREQAGKSLDSAVFSTTAADATRPAGILNGVTPITASTATPLDIAMFRDVEALVGAIADNGGGGNVMLFANPRQAVAMKMRASPSFDIPVIPSPQITAGTVIAVEVDGFASGYDGLPVIDISREFTAHFEDANPGPISTPGAPNVISAPVRSGWQQNLLGLRLRMNLTWATLQPGMVQVVNSVTW